MNHVVKKSKKSKYGIPHEKQHADCVFVLIYDMIFRRYRAQNKAFLPVGKLFTLTEKAALSDVRYGSRTADAAVLSYGADRKGRCQVLRFCRPAYRM